MSLAAQNTSARAFYVVVSRQLPAIGTPLCAAIQTNIASKRAEICSCRTRIDDIDDITLRHLWAHLSDPLSLSSFVAILV